MARRILDELATHTVYVSAPSWDGKWLSVLLRAGGFPRHAMRLRDSDEAMMQSAREGLAGAFAPDKVEAVAADLVERTRRAAAGRLPDADGEREPDLGAGLGCGHGTAERGFLCAVREKHEPPALVECDGDYADAGLEGEGYGHVLMRSKSKVKSQKAKVKSAAGAGLVFTLRSLLR